MKKSELRARLKISVAAGVFALSVAAKSGVEGVTTRNVCGELMADTQGYVVTSASIASSFREAAMEDPSAAVEYFMLSNSSQNVISDWNTSLGLDMSVQQLTDFFTGASVMSGSTGAKISVVGLYNPWWDAILLLDINIDPITDFDNSPLKIVDFIFLSGEMFRGEEVKGAVKCLTVVPESDPLSVELWRVTAGTRKVFMEMFPVEDKSSRAWNRLAPMREKLNVDKDGDMARIQARSTLRLQHAVALLKNARDTGLASFITRLARKGNLYRLYKHFREPNSRVLLKSFSELPETIRKGFTPYCYVPTEKATLYVLVNKEIPTLYVTVSLMKDIKAETSGFEWYYLTQADELLAAWNNRKEVAK